MKNFKKFAMLLVAVMAVGVTMTSCSNEDETIPVVNNVRATETLSSIISADKTLYSNVTYQLSGKTYVTNGATLTIQPGTRMEDESADASGGIASREIESIVSKVLNRYRKREQIVFRKMAEGCPAREVGRMVGYTEATVYKKYSLMRRNIRLALIQGGYILLALLMFTE